jgi:phage repressor protein C with HTH and peptisase S24 domain
MFRIIKVTGHSLSPEYQEGDYVLLHTKPFFFQLKSGDTIVFNQAAYGKMIKKIDRIDYNLVYVVGTHATSVDSRQFGPISLEDITGKVIWHICPR